MRRLLKEIFKRRNSGDTTTLKDFQVIFDLRNQELIKQPTICLHHDHT